MKTNEARMLLAANGCVAYIPPEDMVWYINRFEYIFKIIKLTKHGHQMLVKNLINGDEGWLLTKDVMKASNEEIAEAVSERLKSPKLVSFDFETLPIGGNASVLMSTGSGIGIRWK